MTSTMMMLMIMMLMIMMLMILMMMVMMMMMMMTMIFAKMMMTSMIRNRIRVRLEVLPLDRKKDYFVKDERCIVVAVVVEVVR